MCVCVCIYIRTEHIYSKNIPELEKLKYSFCNSLSILLWLKVWEIVYKEENILIFCLRYIHSE